MRGVYRIERPELGLLSASPGGAPNAPADLRLTHLPGLPVGSLWYWRLGVATETGRREHIAVMAHHPVVLADETCDAVASLLRVLYPSAVLSFVQADSEGHAQVRAGPARGGGRGRGRRGQ